MIALEKMLEMVFPMLIVYPTTCSFFFQRTKIKLSYKWTVPGYFAALALAALPLIVDNYRALDIEEATGLFLMAALTFVASWVTVKALYYLDEISG